MGSAQVIDIGWYRSKMKPVDEPFACPLGVALWER
jgi:hypothetical protein